MATATKDIRTDLFVPRYPIGLAHDRPTLRWYAEIVTPDCDVCPSTGRLVDASSVVIVGDIEYTPGYGPTPGTRELAYKLAGDIAHPLEFQVGAVWH